jgi:hypothetical protein
MARTHGGARNLAEARMAIVGLAHPYRWGLGLAEALPQRKRLREARMAIGSLAHPYMPGLRLVEALP